MATTMCAIELVCCYFFLFLFSPKRVNYLVSVVLGVHDAGGGHGGLRALEEAVLEVVGVLQRSGHGGVELGLVPEVVAATAARERDRVQRVGQGRERGAEEAGVLTEGLGVLSAGRGHVRDGALLNRHAAVRVGEDLAGAEDDEHGQADEVGSQERVVLW